MSRTIKRNRLESILNQISCRLRLAVQTSYAREIQDKWLRIKEELETKILQPETDKEKNPDEIIREELTRLLQERFGQYLAQDEIVHIVNEALLAN